MSKIIFYNLVIHLIGPNLPLKALQRQKVKSWWWSFCEFRCIFDSFLAHILEICKPRFELDRYICVFVRSVLLVNGNPVLSSECRYEM